FCRTLFTATGADHAPEGPQGQASRAEQVTAADIAAAFVDFQDSELWLAATERTAIRAAFKVAAIRLAAQLSKPAGIGLQEGLGKELIIGWRMPVGHQRLVGFRDTRLAEPASFAREQRRAILRHRIQQWAQSLPKFREILVQATRWPPPSDRFVDRFLRSQKARVKVQ